MDKHSENFIRAFRAAMKKPGAPMQRQLADALSLSPGYVNDLLKGDRTRGSERTRRRIAACLGLDYNQMVGMAAAPGQRPTVPLSRRASVINDEFATLPDRLMAVPIVDESVALDGVVQRDSEIRGWLTLVRDTAADDHHCDLIAFRAARWDMAPDIVPGSVVVVNYSDKTIVDNKLYLVGPPSESPVRVVHDGGDDTIVLMCRKPGATLVQTLSRRQAARAIRGRVVYVMQQFNGP